MNPHRYSQRFFDFVDLSAGRSARAFVNHMDFGFTVRSVLDVGCARGIWLDAWKNRGAAEVFGLDGHDVDSASLLIPKSQFLAVDITKPFELQRRFDLVQCLEVAEHLPPANALPLIRNLTLHGDVVLFSAATPGQGGEFHVNEQPLGYWAALFAQCGFSAFDYPRAAVRQVRDIEPWYRFNSVLYANAAGSSRLSEEVRQYQIAADARFSNRAPLSWRLRCALLRTLPPPLILRLAQLKHHAWVALHK